MSTEQILGLSSQEVEKSRQQNGSNELTPPRRASLWQLYIDKYKDPIIRILLVAVVFSFGLSLFDGDFYETTGIFIAVILATSIGFYFERDAAKKFDVLTALSAEQPIKVIREGKVTTIPRKEIVVGDIVLVEVGDEIPADGELISCVDLQIDESSLTGEPICTKYVNPKEAEEESTYPVNLLLRSTMVMSGSGTMCVTAVGDKTEIGKVARKATEMTEIETPLNRQLRNLAGMISKAGFSVAILAFFIFLGHDIFTNDIWHTNNYLKMAHTVLEYFMVSVTLLVMAVPEGLPMAVTLSLALNMRRMLKSNNLVRKLHACETMGAVTVICTDKTGTLTQNCMTVKELLPLNGEDLLPIAISTNTTANLEISQTEGVKGIGNPTEIALLRYLYEKGVSYNTLRQENAVLSQLPFSTERKYMASLVEVKDKKYLFIKGAPEIVIVLCQISDEKKAEIQATLKGYQDRAMRTLAFAYKEIKEAGINLSDKENIKALTLGAVSAIIDPIREDVPKAVEECQKAGITVKILTGDTAATAIEIARQIGTWDDTTPEEAHITGPDFEALSDEEAHKRARGLRVMSRARPTDKQRLVTLLQAQGEIVAVTGDGTNDAPALNYANVGLSLGSGTSVAKEASDMTLLDDSFASIEKAVMWGRSLYNNIRRFILFQLVINLTALLLVLGASVMGSVMPLTVTQILWINLIMDTFAALALAALPPSREVMNERPRPQNEKIISKTMAKAILSWGAIFFVVMGAMLVYFELTTQGEITTYQLTVFFTTFVMLQFWNLLNSKAFGSKSSALSGLLQDKALLGVLALILVGQFLIVKLGGKMFRTEPLTLCHWLYIIAGTSLVLWLKELGTFFYRKVR